MFEGSGGILTVCLCVCTPGDGVVSSVTVAGKGKAQHATQHHQHQTPPKRNTGHQQRHERRMQHSRHRASARSTESSTNKARSSTRDKQSTTERRAAPSTTHTADEMDALRPLDCAPLCSVPGVCGRGQVLITAVLPPKTGS